MAVELHFISPRSDPRLDRVHRQLRISYRSSARGWCSHNVNSSGRCGERLGESGDRLASSLYLITTRQRDQTNTPRAALFVLFAPPRRISQDGQRWVGHPQNRLLRRGPEVLRKLCGSLIRPYSSSPSAGYNDGQIIRRDEMVDRTKAALTVIAVCLAIIAAVVAEASMLNQLGFALEEFLKPLDLSVLGSEFILSFD